MNILFVSDVVSNTGKWVLSKVLAPLRQELEIQLCIANGENLAGGKGLTTNLYNKLRRMGVDVVTTGNHIWDNPDIIATLDREPNLLRPANFPEGNPGHGTAIVSLENSPDVGVLNIQGRVFMPSIDCPFAAAMRETENLRRRTNLIVVDFHAEASSEKIAMGWFLDGKVSAVIGTHTHVPSADERVLPKGTAYITDAGMTGARESVIGIKVDQVIRRLRLQSYVRFEPAEGDPIFNAVFVDIDDHTGKATRIERIFREVKP